MELNGATPHCGKYPSSKHQLNDHNTGDQMAKTTTEAANIFIKE